MANKNYNYENFDKAHAAAIAGISRANKCDLGVARDMLIYMAEHPSGEKYAGLPAGYDMEKLAKDVAELRAQF